MKFCEDCGAQMEDSATVCPVCGEAVDLEDILIGKVDQLIAESGGAQPQQQAYAPQPQPQQPQQAYSQPQPQQSYAQQPQQAYSQPQQQQPYAQQPQQLQQTYTQPQQQQPYAQQPQQLQQTYTQPQQQQPYAQQPPEEKQSNKPLIIGICSGVGAVLVLLLVLLVTGVIHFGSDGEEQVADVATGAAVETAAPTQEPEATPTETPQKTEEPQPLLDDTYVLPTSDSAYITDDDLAGMTKNELRLARNEIYARHGFIFGKDDLKQFFGGKSWYTPTVAAEKFNESSLNKYEKENVTFIVNRENGKLNPCDWETGYYYPYGADGDPVCFIIEKVTRKGITGMWRWDYTEYEEDGEITEEEFYAKFSSDKQKATLTRGDVTTTFTYNGEIITETNDSPTEASWKSRWRMEG
ncbi:MAG: YARHG domain-containing protein [Eubacterium sp.]|nr:YARHG domain-containing protein [Eubacterium sp.]